jgi:hypothetical protein
VAFDGGNVVGQCIETALNALVELVDFSVE